MLPAKCLAPAQGAGLRSPAPQGATSARPQLASPVAHLRVQQRTCIPRAVSGHGPGSPTQQDPRLNFQIDFTDLDGRPRDGQAPYRQPSRGLGPSAFLNRPSNPSSSLPWAPNMDTPGLWYLGPLPEAVHPTGTRKPVNQSSSEPNSTTPASSPRSSGSGANSAAHPGAGAGAGNAGGSPRAAAAKPVAHVPSVTQASVAVNTAMLHAAASALRSAAASVGHLTAGIAQGAGGLHTAGRSLLQRLQRELSSGDATVAELRAQVEALSGANAELAARCEGLKSRMEGAEARARHMQARVEARRALSAVNDAMQVFRRHAAGAPQDLDTTQFYEREEDLVGRGGCARVYAWETTHASAAPGGAPEVRRWVVKSDPISYKYGYTGGFEPERCADLLPALLPPHPNVQAPVAWWVGSAAPSSTLTAPTPEAALAAGSPVEEGPASAFRLYSLYERFTCSVHDLLAALNSSSSSSSSGAAAASADGSADSSSSSSSCAAPALGAEAMLAIVRDVASALEHLAASGVVHADLKAENVMLVLRNPDGSLVEPWAQGGPAPGGVDLSACRVEKAVLIDFGLSRLVNPGGLQHAPQPPSTTASATASSSTSSSTSSTATTAQHMVEARGGTWLYRAPEQMAGPMQPQGGKVCCASDVFALGTLICYMARNGSLPTSRGLPLDVAPEQLVKWGDRPNGKGGVEPFFMTFDQILPSTTACSAPAGANRTSSSASSSGASASVPPSVMAKLRSLAVGCMAADPSKRMPVGAVRAAAEAALVELRRCK